MFLKRKFPHALDRAVPDEMSDVVSNVRTLLNARRGAGSFIDTFGIDVAQFRAAGDAIVALQAQVRENLQLYEPRLELLEVEELYDDDGKPYLELNCRLKSSGEILRISSNKGQEKFNIEPFDPLSTNKEE